MTEEEKKNIRAAILTIDKFLQDHLWDLSAKLPSKWFYVKTDIDELYQKATGKSVYGQH